MEKEIDGFLIAKKIDLCVLVRVKLLLFFY